MIGSDRSVPTVVSSQVRPVRSRKFLTSFRIPDNNPYTIYIYLNTFNRNRDYHFVLLLRRSYKNIKHVIKLSQPAGFELASHSYRDCVLYHPTTGLRDPISQDDNFGRYLRILTYNCTLYVKHYNKKKVKILEQLTYYNK